MFGLGKTRKITVDQARKKIQSLFRHTCLHPCTSPRQVAGGRSSLDELVSILCAFPVLATESIEKLDRDSVSPLVILVYAGGSLKLVQHLCENVPSAIQPKGPAKNWGIVSSSRFENFVCCCSRVKPSVLQYLVRKCPELLSSINSAGGRTETLTKIVKLGAKASTNNEKEAIHDTICVFLYTWPFSCTWISLQAALISAYGCLLDKTIDKMVENFPQGSEIEINHGRARPLVLTTVAGRVLGRLLPRASSFVCSNSNFQYAAEDAFVALMESLLGAVCHPETDFAGVTWRLVLPSEILKKSDRARQAMLSVLEEHLPGELYLHFTSPESKTCTDDRIFEGMGRLFHTSNSAGIPSIRLWDFCLSDLKGLASILTAPHGATKMRLEGLLSFSSPAKDLGFAVEEHTPSLKELYLHAFRFEQEAAFASLLSILRKHGTLQRLTILAYEKSLPSAVTEQLLQVVKHNRQLTHLDIEYLQEAAFGQLCDILGEAEHSLRSMRVVLDPRTPEGRERENNNGSGDEVAADDDEDDNSDDDDESSTYNDAEPTMEDKAQNKQRQDQDDRDSTVYLESSLARTLRTSNTSLMYCCISICYKSSATNLPVNQYLCRQVRYYLSLNYYGRKQAREHCRLDLVKALLGVLEGSSAFIDDANFQYSRSLNHEFHKVGDYEDEEDCLDTHEARNDREKLRRLFGLLREAPCLWTS